MAKIDNFKKRFDKFRVQYESYKKLDLSESDTRSKILDEILINVLGWEEPNIKREGHNSYGFYDYKISIPNFQFIMEAKKDFVELQLPKNHKTSSIGTLVSGNRDVINQIKGYLVEEAIPYGIITNGHQFIISKFFNTDGSKWQDNKSILFNGFEEISERFIEFYNLLSREAVSNNSLYNLLNVEKIEGKTIFSTLGTKQHKELIRNDLTANLTPVLSKVFGEIYKFENLDSKEILKECFIKNQETKKNKSEIEKLIDDKPPELKEVIPVRNTDNTIAYIKDSINKNQAAKDNPPPDPIIIIGSKGAGKTTFINYLFNISLDSDTLASRPYIYLDFRKYDDLSHEKEKIYHDIIEIIYNQYPELKIHDLTVLKRTFYKEIQQRENGIWKHLKESNIPEYNNKISDFLESSIKDTQDHLFKFSEYLIRERRIRLTIIVDNADQKNQTFQREAYKFAAGLNRQAKCSVIISLREGYYYRWRKKPPFDAFEPVVYHITAPPYSEVLQSRIDYALSKIDFRTTTRGRVLDKKVKVTPETIEKFFKNLDKTLFAKDNSEMLRYLEQTSFPNIREGLESFRHFLLSGHTNVHKYVISLEFSIPIWEFIKSIGLNNTLYYNHEISELKNLFYPAEDNFNHFTKVRILRYLYNTTKKLGFREKFVACTDIIELFKKIGYTDRIILREIQLLLDYKLVDTDDNLSDIESIDENHLSNNFCISLKGYYYIDELLNRFHYLSLVLQDTPIFDKEYFKKLNKTFPLSNSDGYQILSKRKESVETFMEYLQVQESKDLDKASVDEALTFSITEEIFNKGLQRDYKRIENALKIYS
ncbi:MAG: hypothetical protein ACQERS_14375 [Bacteroidota bacterium]